LRAVQTAINIPQEQGYLKKQVHRLLHFNYKRYRFIYFLMLPGLIYFLVFNYYPLYFLQIAFKKYSVYSGLDGATWVGFQNFIDLFKTKYFLQAFRNTVILSSMKIFIGFPVPIILALLLNELRSNKYKRGIQTIIYLPHFFSWVIVATIWINILSPDGGIVNSILGIFGVKPIFFMADKGVFRWVLTFSSIWKGAGWGTIIYLAALAGVDQEQYEAAIIDGANRLKQTWYVTLPAILPTISVVFILDLAHVLSIFEQVIAMYNPVVAEVSETIDTYVYQIGIIKGDMAFATAVGLFKNIISLVLVLAANQLSKRIQDGAAVV